MDVLSASPAQLIVIVFDHLLVQLRRTGIAIETGNVDLRSVSLGRSQDALAELMGGLDMERGGELSKQLQSLYAFFIAELIDVGRYNDKGRLERITKHVSELRDAFSQISARQTASAA